MNKHEIAYTTLIGLFIGTLCIGACSIVFGVQNIKIFSVPDKQDLNFVAIGIISSVIGLLIATYMLCKYKIYLINRRILRTAKNIRFVYIFNIVFLTIILIIMRVQTEKFYSQMDEYCKKSLDTDESKLNDNKLLKCRHFLIDCNTRKNTKWNDCFKFQFEKNIGNLGNQRDTRDTRGRP